MNKLDNFSFQSVSPGRIQLACMALVGALDIIAMTLAKSVYADFTQRIIFYMNMLSMLYLGVTISHPMSKMARNLLLTGLLFCAWPLLMQLRDFKFFLNPEHPNGRFLNYTFLCSYVMLFSFAAVADEKEKATGLKIFGWSFIGSSAILTVFMLLFLKGYVPPYLKDFIYWGDDIRVYLIWNPNITARILLLGIGFCLIYLCICKALWKKILFGAVAVCFAALLSLTDSRTVIIMACCLIGGIIFFSIYKGNLKSFLAGIAVAVLTFVLIFLAIHGTYSQYWKYADQQTSLKKAAIEITEESPVSFDNPAVTAEPTLIAAQSGAVTRRPSYASADTKNLKTNSPTEESAVEQMINNRYNEDFNFQFNGRTPIWKNVLKVLKENPKYLITGIRAPEIPPLISEELNKLQPHAHNSWLQILLILGLIGFCFSLYFTWMAFKAAFSLLFIKQSQLYQKAACMLVLTMLGTEFFEPFLFLPEYPKDFMNLAFMLLLGYLIYWDKNTLPLREKQKGSAK